MIPKSGHRFSKKDHAPTKGLRPAPMNEPAQISALTAVAPELLRAGGAMWLLMLGAFRGERAAVAADAIAIAFLVVAGVIVARLPNGRPATLGGSFVIDD